MTGRPIITVGWRPGRPTLRQDEFVETAAERAPETDEPEQGQPEQRAVDSRLINWARWNLAATGSRVAASQTGAICDRLRRASEGIQDNSDERRKIDEHDALLIERNLWKLRGTQRSLLRMHYVNGWKWPVILRVLGRKVKKAHFDIILANAQEAIEYEIDKKGRRG